MSSSYLKRHLRPDLECSLERLVANGDAWVAADILAKDGGLLETDGETKLVTSMSEGAQCVRLGQCHLQTACPLSIHSEP